jgi:hypothetical protein
MPLINLFLRLEIGIMNKLLTMAGGKTVLSTAISGLWRAFRSNWRSFKIYLLILIFNTVFTFNKLQLAFRQVFRVSRVGASEQSVTMFGAKDEWLCRWATTSSSSNKGIRNSKLSRSVPGTVDQTGKMVLPFQQIGGGGRVLPRAIDVSFFFFFSIL